MNVVLLTLAFYYKVEIFFCAISGFYRNHLASFVHSKIFALLFKNKGHSVQREPPSVVTIKHTPDNIITNNNNNNNKVLYLLRCAPSVSHAALETFDSLLRDCIQRITNSNLSDIQWLQASLPVKDGGLWVRRVSSLAIPAYLASAASTLSLQVDILSGCACTDDSYLHSFLSSWSSSFGAIPDTLPARQPFWDRSGIKADRLLVESSLSSAF